MKNIALFFGGKSCEHDISIITAMQIQANVDRKKYNLMPIYITQNNDWFFVKELTEPKQFVDFDEKKYQRVFVIAGKNILFLKTKFSSKQVAPIDVALIACHGLNGEDGTLQGCLELSNIPYSSSSVVSCAVCMDKVFMKQIFEANNLPITKYLWFNKNDFVEHTKKILYNIKHELEYPLIVKPANLGSSIGISRCETESDLQKAIDVAFHYDDKILIEEAVNNLREINCAVCGFQDEIEVSNLDEPISWSELYDFQQKYLSNNIKLFKQELPKLPIYIKNEIKKMSKSVFKVFDCCGVVRIDFLYDDKSEEIFIGEINSIPGSLSNFMFKFGFEELIDKLIKCAINKNKIRNQHEFSFQSKVLSNNFAVKK